MLHFPKSVSKLACLNLRIPPEPTYKTHHRLIDSIPPNTTEQSSNTDSSRSISSLNLAFSFFNNFASPWSPEDVVVPDDNQLAALLPLLIDRRSGEPCSASSPLHHPESSSEVGDVRPSGSNDMR
jgi:hypothetical protein